MALTVTIDSTDRTSVIPFRGGIYGLPAFSMQTEASSFTSKCTIPAVALSGSGITFTEKETVLVEDGGTLWAGFIANIRATPIGTDTVAYVLNCQDNNILLEETVVPSESYASQADSAVIDDLFTTYLPAIDSTTYVTTIDASMEAIEFDGKTLRRCLTMISNLTGGMFYVDHSDNLHYFDGTESNAAAWNLSDNPSAPATYPYENLTCVVDGAIIIDRVYVIGTNVFGWVGSGDYEAIVWDPGIVTAQGVIDRGNAIIARYASGQTTYTCQIRKDGLEAGMDIDITNALLGLSAETLTVRRITMTCADDPGNERLYQLELGDVLYTPQSGQRAAGDVVGNNSQNSGSVADDIYDTDAPSAPALTGGNLTTGVDIDADGHQVVYLQVTWGSVADTDLDHYQVQVSTSSDFSGYTITRDHPKDGDRIERFVPLVGSTTYYVRVRAEDWVGNDSAWSTTQNLATTADSVAPAQVSGLVATGARTLIGLIWTANSEADLSYYEIQRDNDAAGSPSGAWAEVAQAKLNFYIDENHTEAAVQASTKYHYRVRAVDTSGNAGTWSASDDGTLDPLGSDSLAADSVVANKIAANAVTADKIDVVDLSAINADLGTITAGTVTGATIQTAAAGARVVMDSVDGIRIFNSTPTLTGQFDVDGSGQLGATGLNPIVWNTAGQLDQLNANQITLGVGGNNVLVNSAFLYDDDADDTPDGWTLLGTAANYAVDLDTVVYRIGGVSAEIELTAGNGSGENRRFSQSVDLSEIGLNVGDDFVLSGFVKAVSVSNIDVSLEVRWLDAGSGVLQTDEATSLTATTGWARYSKTNTIPASAVTAQVRVLVTTTAGNGTGTGFFDGIQLERGDMATDWKPGLIGNVTIDGNRVEVLDSGGGRIIVGKRGTDFGTFGEDAAGNLEVGWYASGNNAGMITAGAGAVILGTDGMSMESQTGGGSLSRRKFRIGDLSSGVINNVFAEIFADRSSGLTETTLFIEGLSYPSDDMHVRIRAKMDTDGAKAYVTLLAQDPSATDFAQFEVIVNSADPYFIFSQDDICIGDRTHYLYRSGVDLYWYDGTSGTKLN